MRIRRIAIQNFRGIEECEWWLDTPLACLVGPGDSTKTTILDAVGLALSRNYTVQFVDSDFHRCDASKPIVVQVLVSGFPPDLNTNQHFSFYRSFLGSKNILQSEPIGDVIPGLDIRLTVDDSLEPQWVVIRPDGQSKYISAADRRLLGFFRLGEHVDMHLRWSRTSALTTLSEKSPETKSILVSAARAAREAVFNHHNEELNRTTDDVAKLSKLMGSNHGSTLRAGLDPTGVATSHALVLHDGEIPLTTSGLGSRRLAALSIQEGAVEKGAIIGIDEIEHGLEPHRLSHVLRHLKESKNYTNGQILFTTHSPITIINLSIEDIYVVRSANGKTRVQRVVASLKDGQGFIRSSPDGLLSRRIIVGEGATEVGFLRHLLVHIDQTLQEYPSPTSITAGVAIIDGGGANSISRASSFNELGYPTLLLMDNDDRNIDSKIEVARSTGVGITQWSSGNCLESELVLHSSLEILSEMLKIISGTIDESRMIRSLRDKSKLDSIKGLDVSSWIVNPEDEAVVRRALTDCLKGNAWGIKSQTGGELLAEAFVNHLPHFEQTAMRGPISQIREFTYGL